ncbi:MAG: LysE family translocator [Nevskia sp.]|nr:LysE family translocator [Nevskia sp.]
MSAVLAGPLLAGIAVGFSIAAPVGPIGLLVIRRSLARGFVLGLVTGMGAATADTCFGVVAAFGLTVISSFLQEVSTPLSLVGGAFLVWLGLRTIRSPPPDDAAAGGGTSLAAAYGSTFLLTLSNPATILSFAAVFTVFGVAAYSDYTAASTVVAGVFAGSTLWWLLLSGTTAWLRGRIRPAWLTGINRFSGALLCGFGIMVFARAVLPWMSGLR